MREHQQKMTKLVVSEPASSLIHRFPIVNDITYDHMTGMLTYVLQEDLNQ